jgi:hypothetical protein
VPLNDRPGNPQISHEAEFDLDTPSTNVLTATQFDLELARQF